jgi:hypothetical protein
MTANEDSSEASATAVQRKNRARREGQMSIWQIGFVVRSGVSALAVAFLLNYSAQYEWGLSRYDSVQRVGCRSDYRNARGHRS